jgi:hypothetical protein
MASGSIKRSPEHLMASFAGMSLECSWTSLRLA